MNKIANINKLKKILKSRLNDKKYRHSVNVMNISEKLAKINNINSDKIKIAALLHDIAKSINQKELKKYIIKYNLEYDNICSPSSLHGQVGSILIKKNLEIHDKQILDAVSCHTNGKPNMTSMEKIICVSDFIEKKKNGYIPKKIEEFSESDINKSLFLLLDYKIRLLKKSNKFINKMILNSRDYMFQYIKNQNEIIRNSEIIFDNLIIGINKNIKKLGEELANIDFEKLKNYKEIKIHNFKWFKPWTWNKYGSYSIKKELEDKRPRILIYDVIENLNKQYIKYKNDILDIFKNNNISNIRIDLLTLISKKIDSNNYYDYIEKLLKKSEINIDRKFNIKKIKKSNYKKIPNEIFLDKDIIRFNELCFKLSNEIIENTEVHTNLFISEIYSVRILYFKSIKKLY